MTYPYKAMLVHNWDNPAPYEIVEGSVVLSRTGEWVKVENGETYHVTSVVPEAFVARAKEFLETRKKMHAELDAQKKELFELFNEMSRQGAR